MQRQSSDLEGRIDELSRRLSGVERRLAALERPLSAETVEPGAAGAVAAAGPRSRGGLSEGLPLSGRTMVVLGGAFLLRAITEAGVLPRAVGTALGLAYAIVWVVMADRAAAAGRRLSATFHGLVGTGIAFALLWEATVKFEFLPATSSAVALALFTALALAVVVRRSLRGLAWAVTLGAAVTALAVAVPTKMWVSHVFVLLALAFAMMWLGREREWHALTWVLSGLVGGTILLMTAMILMADLDRVTELFNPDSLLAIQLSWVVIFFGTLGYRTLLADEDVTVGEIVLGLVAFVVGFGGATVVTRMTWVHATSLAAVSLALAAGFYGVAFSIADRKLGRRRNFIYYSTLALLVTLVASGALLEGAAQVLTLSFVALVTAWLGTRKARATLSLHSAVYIIFAAAVSGLPAGALDVFGGASLPGLGWVTLHLLVVLATAGVFFWLPVAGHGRTWGRFSQAPKLAVTVVLLLGLGAIAVTAAGRLLSLALGSSPDAAGIAALRTGALAVTAVVLAWLSRWPRWPEAYWLVYPALALGGLKLLLEDVRSGRPVTLFFSFVLYGAALILAPRLARRAA